MHLYIDMRTALRLIVWLSTSATVARGHSALISPLPRNAVDRNLKPWKQAGPGAQRWGPGTLPGSPPGTPHPQCDHPARSDGGGCWGCTCVNGTEPCDVGQTCVYFSQGCSIGCTYLLQSIYVLSLCVCARAWMCARVSVSLC